MIKTGTAYGFIKCDKPIAQVRETISAIKNGKLNSEEAPLRISTRIEELSFAALPTKTKKRSKKK